MLIAGDLIVNRPEHAQYLSALSTLAARFPTYAVLGDHDYQVDKQHGQWSINTETAKTVAKQLEQAGIRVMTNEAVSIKLNNASFWLLGLDDWLARKTNAQRAFAQTDGQGPLVVLVHNPDFILDPDSRRADFIVSGNTHGGQIRLPWIGPIPSLPSKLPRIYDEGLFEEPRYSSLVPKAFGTSEESPAFYKVRDPSATPQNDAVRQLFITSGISESGPRARLFNPPEIALLELY